jgi:hypothetical protein
MSILPCTVIINMLWEGRRNGQVSVLWRAITEVLWPWFPFRLLLLPSFQRKSIGAWVASDFTGERAHSFPPCIFLSQLDKTSRVAPTSTECSLDAQLNCQVFVMVNLSSYTSDFGRAPLSKQ